MRKLLLAILLMAMVVPSYANNLLTLGVDSGAVQMSAPQAGLLLWLRAEDITGLVDGNEVLSWTDNTSNAYVFSTVTTLAPVYRVNALNGYPAVEFDGSNDLMAMGVLESAAFNPTTVSVYAVGRVRQPAPASSGIFILKNATLPAGNAPWTLYNGQTASTPNYANSALVIASGTASIVGSAVATDVYFYAGFTYDGTTTNLYLSGVADGTSGSATGNIGSTTGLVQIGGYDGSFSISEFGKIDIVELLVYGHALDAGEIAALNTYLETKYGL